MIKKLYVVGLTGPTGAGKSVVAGVFADNNISIIDADVLARRVVEPGSECLKKLVDSFSNEILMEDGSLNRRELGRRAFSNAENSKLLNSITHPYIIELTKTILKQKEQMHIPAVIIDAPLLFESGMDAVCDLTVVVIAPFEKRLKRILKRDRGLDEKQARARMAAQQHDEYYTSRASIVLQSDNNLDILKDHAKKLAKNILEWSHEK